MRFLLDTNVVSNLIREPQGRVADRIKVLGENRVCTSIIVAAELRYGAVRGASRRLSAQVDAVLNVIDILPFDPPSDEAYGVMRTQLELAGTPIGSDDLLIAAQAITLGYTLVTDNEDEFARISGLRVDNWLRK